MRHCMNCHLLIPDLFWHSGDEAYREPDSPALHTLLARAATVQGSAQDLEEWLCRAFSVDKQQDWPIAALTLLADGGSPRNDYWLRADPVYLRVDLSELILADSRAFGITQDEANQLTQALNSHFNNSDLVFRAVQPERWYLRLEESPKLQTRGLNEVAGKNIDEFLPIGADSVYWHGVCNEIQMVLHNHPVNEAREAAGYPPLNSVWLWGGGRLPTIAVKPFAQVWTNECLAKGLALASGAAISSLPQNAPAWLSQFDVPGVHLVVLDSLRFAAQYGDRERWMENMEKLEERWFAPLLSALQRGELEELTISSGSRSFAIARRDLWKLWRRRKALADYSQLS